MRVEVTRAVISNCADYKLQMAHPNRLTRKCVFASIEGMILAVHLHSFAIDLQVQTHVLAAFTE